MHPNKTEQLIDKTIGEVGKYSIQTLNSPELIKTEWKQLEQQETGSIYQSYAWVKVCCDTLESNNSVFIITGRDDEDLQFILPMVLEGSFIKTLRWIGNTHANICSGLFSEAFLKSSDKALMGDIFKLIGSSAGKIVQTRLHNQPKSLKNYTNPLAHLDRQTSVNKMYDMDLRDGINTILDAGNGKRKRKLWRKQNRVADDMGGFELVIPKTQADINQAIDEFLVLKTKRFDEMGVKDVFADDATKEFLYKMANTPEDENVNLFEIYQLKIAGITRAMYAIGIYGKYCQAYVNAVSYDDFSSQSPGEMIIYAMVESLSEQGYERLDLGVGNERYKRSWCPGEHELFDTTLPLSGMAKPVVHAMRAKNDIKRYLRNNETIWRQIKKIRKIKVSLLNSKP